LGLGTTLGIALMALVQFSVVAKSVTLVSPRRAITHRAVRKLATLSMWSVGYVIANQVALIVVKNLADPGSGWVDAYAKAYVLLQLPHGLLAVSIATTFVPDLAAAAKRGSADFVSIASRGIRLTALVTFPASVGIFVLARPIVGMVFAHGNFDLAAADTTTGVVRAMALGLGGFSLYLFVLRCFYAQGDTKTPFFINLVENAVNVVLAVVLIDRHGVAGLGYAFAGAYLSAALIALIVLTRMHGLDFAATAIDLATLVVGSIVMGALVELVAARVGSNVGLGASGRIGLGIAVGTLAYGAYATACSRDVRNYLSSRTTRSSR
jgi:putative peptidoglycan lipid II flippase